MQSCVKKVKKGAGSWYISIIISITGAALQNVVFHFEYVSKTSLVIAPAAKNLVCLLLAYIVYLPFIYFSKALDWIGLKRLSNQIPLSYYKSHSWNIIKNDALIDSALRWNSGFRDKKSNP